MKKLKYFYVNFPIMHTWLNAEKLWKEVTLLLFVKRTGRVTACCTLVSTLLFCPGWQGQEFILGSSQVFG